MSDSIDIRVGADSRPLQTTLQRARQSVRDFAQSAQSHMIAGAGAIGAALSVGAITSFASEMMDLAGNLQDMSDKLKVGVVTLQELQHAFGQGGASAEDIDKAMSKLAENAISALGGNQKLVESFQRLGVTMSDLGSMSYDEIIMKIAESADEAADPAQRLSDILDTLGKSGAKMAPGLNAGREALQQLRDDAVTLTADQVSRLDDAGDAIANFWNGVKIRTTKGYLDIVDTLANSFSFDPNEMKKPAKDFFKGDTPTEGEEDASAALDEESKQARIAAAEKQRIENEKKQLEELDEWQRKQVVAFLGLKETADASAAARRKQEIESIYETERQQYDAFLAHKAQKEEAAREAAQKKDRDKTDRSNQIRENAKALEQKEADDFIEGELAGPAARLEAKRQEAREKRALNKFGRLERLKARGGKAEADVPGQPEVNRVDPPGKEDLIPKGFVSDINTLQRTLTGIASKIGVAQ